MAHGVNELIAALPNSLSGQIIVPGAPSTDGWFPPAELPWLLAMPPDSLYKDSRLIRMCDARCRLETQENRVQRRELRHYDRVDR